MIPNKTYNNQRCTQGDSGGPELIYDEETKQNIEIGIASWVPDLPNNDWDFYTRLVNPLYLNWINKLVNSNK